MLHPLPDASALTLQVLAAAARRSGDPCIVTVAPLHSLLRVTVESTDASGGDYQRSAVGLTYEGALRALLSVLAQDAANDDSDPEAPPPCVALDLTLDTTTSDEEWPVDATDAGFDGCTLVLSDRDVDALAMEMAAREAEVAGEWRVAS